MISLFEALGWCLLISFGYVASLYVWKLRENRDSPRVIRRRFLSVGVVTILSTLIVSQVSSGDWISLLGLRDGVLATIVGLSVTSLLYLGEIMLRIENPEHRETLWEPWEWGWWRNIVVGPLTEEWVFRGCLAALLRGGGVSVAATAWSVPLLFGVAHAHHWLTHASLAAALFQVAYTTLFGLWAATLLLRTGSLGAPLAAHALCNALGISAFDAVPSASWRVKVASLVGPLLFLLLLFPATDPLFFRSIYFQEPFPF